MQFGQFYILGNSGVGDFAPPPFVNNNAKNANICDGTFVTLFEITVALFGLIQIIFLV